MKKLTLIEQLDRIQQMMGVPQKLIMEQPANFIVEKGAKQLWKTLEELFTGTIEKGTEKSLEKTLEKLENVVGRENVAALKLISKGAEDVAAKNTKIVEFLANNPVIKNNIERMLEADVTYTEALNKSTDKFIKDPEVSAYLNDFYTAALDKSGGDIEKSRKVLIDVLADDFTEQELTRYFDAVNVEKLQNGEFTIKFKDAEPVIDDITDIAGNGEGIISWSQSLKNITLKTKEEIQKFIRTLISETSASDLQDYANIMKNWFKGPEKLQAEFNDLMKTIEKKITPGDPLFGQEYKDELYRAGILISSIRNTMNAQPKTFYDLWLKSQNPNIQRILKTGEEGAVFQEFWKQVSKDRKMLLPLETEFAAFKKAMPIAIRLFKGGKFNFQFFNPNFEWSRLRNLVLTLDARTSREWRDVLISRGANNEVMATVAFRYLTASVVVPIYVQTLSFAGRSALSGIESVGNMFRPGDKQWAFVDYNEEGLGADQTLEIIKKEWFDKVSSEIDFTPVADLLSLFTNTPIKTAEKLLLGQTFTDEVWNVLLAPYLTGGKSVTPEDKENFNKQLQEWGKKTQKEWEDWKNGLSPEQRKIVEDFEDVQKNAKEALERAKKKVEPIVDKLADGEAGFNAFCSLTKDAEFRKKHGIDKEYSFKEWKDLAGLTNETNPLGSNTWYWDTNSNIFKPYN
jgi:hypothetical protein